MANEESIDKLRNMVNQLVKTEEEVIDLTGKAADKAEMQR